MKMLSIFALRLSVFLCLCCVQAKADISCYASKDDMEICVTSPGEILYQFVVNDQHCSNLKALGFTVTANQTNCELEKKVEGYCSVRIVKPHTPNWETAYHFYNSNKEEAANFCNNIVNAKYKKNAKVTWSEEEEKP